PLSLFLFLRARARCTLFPYTTLFRSQEHGAAGVLIYSDPADDGWRRGDKYPQGPWRPGTGVQRGSIGYMFQFPGDPTTPGVASRSEEHTSELQSLAYLVCRLLLEKKN